MRTALSKIVGVKRFGVETTQTGEEEERERNGWGRGGGGVTESRSARGATAQAF